MKKSFIDTRQHLLDIGLELMARSGFSAVGLSQILAKANVPKGSFYHYFTSKEQFANTVLAAYFDAYLQEMDQHLAHANTPQGLMPYFEHWYDSYGQECQQQRCLVVKLSAEVADLSDDMRLTLVNGSQAIIDKLEHALLAQQADLQPQAMRLANHLYQLWLGASLLTKLQRSKQPLDLALIQTQQWLSQWQRPCH
ncbi:TetR/AcrR family transcriptional regulator [Shewanella sp. NIFS-20-20]|uniref:TetR/AcrR family transcriptional regulator n=1 Tax=Shewanella sp. NIFS-20-20 TaxID=2853806 RepID=UPI001C467005|nr:TetR/AcrR family transcriptional regulator [Shewanella sp. NIFS-20-20]MBV7315226.1 TetR/AcrR family transcriptional regulator [Shewanella sp. NIFS-20-20]